MNDIMWSIEDENDLFAKQMYEQLNRLCREDADFAQAWWHALQVVIARMDAAVVTQVYGEINGDVFRKGPR